MPDPITVCEQAARAAGEVLLDWQGRFRVEEKAPADLVTEADVAAQQTIREILLSAFPEHLFLGEEDGIPPADWPSLLTGNRQGPPVWVVDPLDGTTNYVHGMHDFCVSVAMVSGGQPAVATIYAPVSQECYKATRGAGAYCNGQRLAASGVKQLSEALVALSFAPRVSRDSATIKQFIEVLLRAQAVRRMGSAALNLCHVAAGRLDAYWATSCKPWDLAAGVLMVEEASGVVTGVDGQPFELADPHFACSATSQLQTELVALLRQASQ